MRKILAAFALISMATVSAHANELDNEAAVTNEQIQLSQDLPATLVIRVKAGTQEVEVLHSSERLATDDATRAAIATREFSKMDLQGQMTNQMVSELDQDSSKSSWYFCFPSYNWYQPSYYYAGYAYNYAAYNSYYWGGYNYYYYGWSYNNSWGYNNGWW